MRVGDLVIHMTGGYLMTVGKIQKEKVECIWFDNEMFYCNKTFQRNTLIPMLPSVVKGITCGEIKGATIRTPSES